MNMVRHPAPTAKPICEFIDRLAPYTLGDNPEATEIFTTLLREQTNSVKYDVDQILCKDKNYMIVKRGDKYHISGQLNISKVCDIISNIRADSDTFALNVSCGIKLSSKQIEGMFIPIAAMPYSSIDYNMTYDHIHDIPEEIHIRYTAYTITNQLHKMLMNDIWVDTTNFIIYKDGVMISTIF